MQNEQNELTGGAMPLNTAVHRLQTPVVQNLTPYRQCPNCGKEWMSEEIEYQACDDCGYPLQDKQNDFSEKVFGFSAIEYLH